MSELVAFEFDGELVVDSRLVAIRLGIEHESFARTIRRYETVVVQRFGILRFGVGEIEGRGQPEKYYLLTEDQSYFLMTLSRNTPEVIECKADLVESFSKAKKLLQRQEEVRSASNRVPYWYKRISIAMKDKDNPLRAGYFCVYIEMMRFFSELEARLEYVIDDKDLETGMHLVPDIAIAKRFNDWLRSDSEAACQIRERFLGSRDPVDFRPARKLKNGHEPAGNYHTDIKMYNHVYPKVSHGNFDVQEARSYPNKYKPIFHYYLEEIWIPTYCVQYLEKRDPLGLEYIRQTFSLMPTQTQVAFLKTLVGKLICALPPAA